MNSGFQHRVPEGGTALKQTDSPGKHGFNVQSQHLRRKWKHLTGYFYLSSYRKTNKRLEPEEQANKKKKESWPESVDATQDWK